MSVGSPDPWRDLCPLATGPQCSSGAQEVGVPRENMRPPLRFWCRDLLGRLRADLAPFGMQCGVVVTSSTLTGRKVPAPQMQGHWVNCTPIAPDRPAAPRRNASERGRGPPSTAAPNGFWIVIVILRNAATAKPAM